MSQALVKARRLFAHLAIGALCTGLPGFFEDTMAGGPAAQAAQQQTQTEPLPTPSATAQPEQHQTPPPPSSQPALSASEQGEIDALKAPGLALTNEIDALEKAVERFKTDDEALSRLRSDIESLMERARLNALALEPRLNQITAQIDKLGPAPAKDAAPESQELAAERARLNATAAEITGTLKTTDLAIVRARQLLEKVQSLRQSLFASHVLNRSSSPLSPDTWKQISNDIPWANSQITRFAHNWAEAAADKMVQFGVLLAAVVALYLALKSLVRNLIETRLSAVREPPTFFARATAAAWVAPASAVPASAALLLAYIGLDALGLVTQELGRIAYVAVPAVLIYVWVSALAYAILAPRWPPWRLADIDDRSAFRLARILSGMALIYAADLVFQEIVHHLYLPVSISIAETAVASIGVGILALELVRTTFLPRAEPFPTEPAPAQGRLLSPAIIKVPVLVLAVAILSLALVGYIGLARFLSTQVVILGSLASLVFILHLGVRAVLGGSDAEVSPFERFLQERMGLDPAQSAIFSRLLALVLNGILILCTIPLVLVTWGYSPPEALAWLRSAFFGFEIGQVRISLARIFVAILLFLALVLATRLAQRWLDRGLLRSHRLDRGITNSIHTALGYAGFLLALLVALSYGGLDITSFAIVAGALSVGIGFGLQSIVNNFVSGLILLVERPIKVGDWVSVKGQEGFVRRIAVRATEIETPDRASLIVPNSDFITSPVTNSSHRNTLSRVLVKVSVSHNEDPERVRDTLQTTAGECPLLMQHPPPAVGFDDFGPNALEFSVTGVVSEFTKAGEAQTDLRMRILKAFRAQGIELASPQLEVHLRDRDLLRQRRPGAREDQRSSPGAGGKIDG